MRTREFSHLQRAQAMDATRASRATQIGEGPDHPGHLVRMELRSNGQAAPAPETGSAPGSDLLLCAVLHAFDVLGIGWIVCDASSHVLGVNWTAENIMKNRDGLELDCNGVLRTACEENVSLAEAVKRAAEPTRFKNSGKQDVTLAVSRRPEKPPLTVFVRRVQGTSQDGSGRPMALVLTLDSLVCSNTTADDLYRLYGLTSTESRLARLLMEGRTLKDCCCELGIDLSTGQTHLKHIFKKTRTRRQSELVMLLFKSIGLARLGVETSETNTSPVGITVH
jgi:DNA-binding CsgD family transcriptional regulator